MSNIGPYFAILPFALLVIIIFLIWLCAPRLFISFFVRLVLLFSKFRYRKYIRLDGNIKASYLKRGSIDSCKVSILCLHGISGSAADFTGILSKFDEDDCHVVALDLLNHGCSPCIQKDVQVEDMVHFVKKFVERVGLHRRKFHIIAFSMGTGTGSLYTSMYPDDIASLTLCAPFCKISPEIAALDGLPKNKTEMLSMIDLMSSNKMKNPPSFIVRALIDRNKHIAENIEKVQNGLKLFQFTPEMLQKIEVNTFVLWGDEDRVCLIEGSEVLKENIKNFDMKIINNCGHLMYMTNVDDVARHLMDWLSSQIQEVMD